MSDTARPRPSARRRAPDEVDGGGAGSTAVADALDVTGTQDEDPTTAPEGDAADPEPAVRSRRGLRRAGRHATADGTDDHLDGTDRDADTDGRTDADGDLAAAPRERRRTSVPLVPVLGVLLLLLLGLNAFLLAPRFTGEESSVRTGTYVDVLQAARANVVDLTSFDHLTIDDDIEQARRVTTGDLTDESVEGLERVRQQLVDGQAVTSTEVVGAGVTRATDDEGTVVMVIATTRQAAGVPAQVRRDRIEVDLQRVGDRWLLSAIRGTPDE